MGAILFTYLFSNKLCETVLPTVLQFYKAATCLILFYAKQLHYVTLSLMNSDLFQLFHLDSVLQKVFFITNVLLNCQRHKIHNLQCLWPQLNIWSQISDTAAVIHLFRFSTKRSIPSTPAVTVMSSSL